MRSGTEISGHGHRHEGKGRGYVMTLRGKTVVSAWPICIAATQELAGVCVNRQGRPGAICRAAAPPPLVVPPPQFRRPGSRVLPASKRAFFVLAVGSLLVNRLGHWLAAPALECLGATHIFLGFVPRTSHRSSGPNGRRQTKSRKENKSGAAGGRRQPQPAPQQSQPY